MSHTIDTGSDSRNVAPGSASQSRLLWLDIARSVALLGMIVFHFTRDLEVFGFIASGTTLTGGWATFARLVAGSFLFLSGLSFVLAHRGGFRTRAWARRLVIICGAAGLVTIATLAVFPTRFIYFGILHAIAAASLIGVFFLHVPAMAALFTGLAVLAIDRFVGPGILQSQWLVWTGLSVAAQPSLDFIPLVPWLAPFLFGMALARLLPSESSRSSWSTKPWLRMAAWPGQHSLMVYLLHQPLLLGLVWGSAQLLR
ncbi:heparan-alpha-glucosaminide N-acetyltransferase [Meridianimarinicoccus sp. RP-17]|uniref:heparan-alpha-glucosaminide N-acetyltransferase n=1 Tax=Meridianimarinicoccus zhengii TaxID=2056810 RepID=UPI000DAED3F3|nr:heparan-alpha-glucosaminide N-acetyltransferase [Phycocomes zhengii]